MFLEQGFCQKARRAKQKILNGLTQRARSGEAARFGLRREAQRHAAFELVWRAKAVSPLRSATALQNEAAVKGVGP